MPIWKKFSLAQTFVELNEAQIKKKTQQIAGPVGYDIVPDATRVHDGVGISSCPFVYQMIGWLI